ncbi:MAG: copper resistance protein B [Burkholderiaceae bacterium]|nr:copper resistance protein B [Burkholderiaceae bacterium]MDH3459869.1 copper resistance protein B [Burkholderiaceae bacterium]
MAATDAPQPEAGHAGHHGDAPAASAPASGPAMGHGDMQMDMKMQGGSPPPDARDPHAYSGGYTLQSGPYVLGSERQLRLADEKAFGTVLFDNLEAVRSHGNSSAAYDALARLGRDYDKLVIKAEGEVDDGKVHEARTEALWSHAVATFWDTQLGVRQDSGVGPDRTWLALGVQGLAPYWFEIDATAYVGDGGRTGLRLDAEYELLITQKLIVQPHIEANLFGKSDDEREIGKGLSDLTVGVRLRYEFTRQFAPYVGIEWAGRFGDTADIARTAGERTHETRYVAGVRFWF